MSIASKAAEMDFDTLASKVVRALLVVVLSTSALALCYAAGQHSVMGEGVDCYVKSADWVKDKRHRWHPELSVKLGEMHKGVCVVSELPEQL